MQKFKVGENVYTKYISFNEGEEILPHELWNTKVIKYDSSIQLNPYEIKWKYWSKYDNELVSQDIMYESNEIVIVKNKTIQDMIKKTKDNIIGMNTINFTRFKRCKKTLKEFNKLIQSNMNFWKIPVEQPKSISKILLRYKTHELQQTEKKKEWLDEIIIFIKKKFNILLPLKLLYKKEKLKFNNYKTTQREYDYCNDFGIEYLYRFLITIPEMIYVNQNDADELKFFEYEINDLLKFLELYDN